MIAAIGFVFLLGDVIAFKFTKVDRKKLYPMFVLAIWYVICGLLGLPIVILFAVTFFIAPSAALLNKQIKTSQRIVTAAFLLVIACFMCFMEGDERIVLADNEFRSTPTGFTKLSGYHFDEATFPRNAVEVSAFTFPHSVWFGFGPQWGWDVDTHGMRTTYFSGHDYFWGPHGLVRGDTLGKHIADWSGTKPTYKHYER